MRAMGRVWERRCLRQRLLGIVILGEQCLPDRSDRRLWTAQVLLLDIAVGVYKVLNRSVLVLL